MEDRTLLSISSLSWRSSNSSSAPVITNANPGQTVYLRADGTAGTYTIDIYEEEDNVADVTDDYVTSKSITIGSSGYGFASWTTAASTQDHGSPVQSFYGYYDVPWNPVDRYSGSLELNPDLQVIDMTMNNQTPLPSVHPGDSVRLDFEVKNFGPGDTPSNVLLKWYWGTTNGSTTN